MINLLKNGVFMNVNLDFLEKVSFQIKKKLEIFVIFIYFYDIYFYKFYI